MKNLKTYETYSEELLIQKVNNEYSEIKKANRTGSIDLGLVDQVSKTTINNIKQTYKDGILRIIDDHYILSI